MFGSETTEQVGTVYVDAGMVWVGDPCYILGQDASHPTKEWSDFCELLDEKGFYERHNNRTVQPFGEGIGFGIESGYGDGEYPVFVTYNDEGRVKSIEIKFEEDEPEDDDNGGWY